MSIPRRLQEPGDAQGLGDISAERNVGDGRDLDALERLVDRRTGDQGRACIAAVKDEIADAELHRRRQPRPEMRVAQEDVGDLRVTRDHRKLKCEGPPRDAPGVLTLRAAGRTNGGPRLRAIANFA